MGEFISTLIIPMVAKCGVEIPYLEKRIPTAHAVISMPDKVPALEEEGEPAGYSLLVVEDTTDMLEFLAKNLGNAYTIHTATNGKEALECLETTTVDLIISDIVMPHMDGFELLKSIRSDNMLCHIPFILLSALDSIDSKIAGLDYGADAYIEKPFSLSHMKATINNLLENRRMLFNQLYNRSEYVIRPDINEQNRREMAEHDQ